LTVTNGYPTYTFLWTGPNGFTATTQDVMCVDPGLYTVQVTDSTGCIVTEQFTVGITSATLNISAWVVSGTIDYLWSDISGGLPPYYLSWSLNGNPFAYGTSTGGPTIGPQLAGNGTYILTVTDENGCTGSTYVEVNNDPQNDGTYNCVDGGCVSATNVTYANLAACNAAPCGIRQDTWRCDDGCYPHPSGQFLSQSACQAQCQLDGSVQYGCEILCGGSGESEDYLPDGDKRNDTEDQDSGGLCRIKLATDTFATGVFEGPYENLDACHASCPWCKNEGEY
jgi:hypothetical protein